MHDIKMIRENPEAFDAALARRGIEAVSPAILALDTERRALILAAETAQAEQNQASKRVGAAKASGDEAEFVRLRALVGEKKAEVAQMQAQAKDKDEELNTLLMTIANVPYEDTPDGANEDDNVEMRTVGNIPNLDFDAKEHFDIKGVAANMDFEAAAKLSGARFMVLAGAVARVHRALAQFMIDLHVEEHGLTEMWAPVLVRDDMMLGTGQLPKFGEDSYQTTNGWWLVPTAEVPLTNLVNGEVVDEASLPKRMVAHTQCFRSEAGSAGRDTAGILRQHQFEKVEMVSVVHPDQSRAELDRMTKCAETILERLGIAFRTMALCTGDMGFGARRTHDIEVWLPGQGKYREISSCSTCGDFQARRMNARFKPQDGGKPEFVHTLNGSGLAVGRALIAVLENYQQEDGSVALPDALHPYLRGKTRISSNGDLV